MSAVLSVFSAKTYMAKMGGTNAANNTVDGAPSITTIYSDDDDATSAATRIAISVVRVDDFALPALEK